MLDDARMEIASWQEKYFDVRPHSSLRFKASKECMSESTRDCEDSQPPSK